MEQLRSQKEQWQKQVEQLQSLLVDAQTTADRTKVLLESTLSQLSEIRLEKAAVEENFATTQKTLKASLREKEDELRALHNAVVDLRGRIRVSLRVRPFIGDETGQSMSHLDFPSFNSIQLDIGKTSSQFEFERVFGPRTTQTRVFDEVRDFLLSVLHGYNVALLAFGQTGSGKTHTMRGGDGEEEGLIPRALRFVFEQKVLLEQLDWELSFAASFLEVYNDDVYDLLKKQREKLSLKLGTGRVVVSGLSEVPIRNENDIDQLLVTADSNRRTAKTRSNETSSRSHAIFALHVTAKNTSTGAEMSSVLHLVDLAGSERAKETGAEGERFVEMTKINAALSAMQNVIRAQLKRQSHVPYRDNKLTTLLQDSLGAGNSKTMVIVHVSPMLSAANETKRSLEFASQMSQASIGIARKQSV